MAMIAPIMYNFDTETHNPFDLALIRIWPEKNKSTCLDYIVQIHMLI